jgi:hypothetical protein
MPPEVAAIRDRGYARWARDWQVELEALDGSHFEVNSELLVAASA